MGGTFVCDAAIRAGEIDAYVEDSGTALTAVRNQPNANVADEYAKRGLRWSPPLGFNNTFAIIIRDEDAKRYGIRTISEAADYTPKWKAGFGYEFMERKDGFPGLAALYGLKFSEPPRVMDLTLTYRAIAEKQVDFIAGNSTDGIISRLKLFVLEDDRHYFPPYDAAPVIRAEVLRKHPQIRAALQKLGNSISEEEMRRMNYEVDGEHKDVKVVATDFLKKMESRGGR